MADEVKDEVVEEVEEGKEDEKKKGFLGKLKSKILTDQDEQAALL